MKRKIVTSLLIIACLGLTGCQLPFPGTTTGPQFAQSAQAQEFTLTDQDGQPFSMSQQRGKVVLLFFGYTFCPDVCPTTLATWRQVESQLGSDAQDVAFVFITVDPERDTQERLKQHVEAFSEDFIGLTGTAEELTSVYQAYNIYHEQEDESNSAAGYLVSHTASSFLIDPQGKSQNRFRFGTTADEMVEEIRNYLQ